MRRADPHQRICHLGWLHELSVSVMLPPPLDLSLELLEVVQEYLPGLLMQGILVFALLFDFHVLKLFLQVFVSLHLVLQLLDVSHSTVCVFEGVRFIKRFLTPMAVRGEA